MSRRLLLMVGTPKGSFILESDGGRDRWDMRGPLTDGWPIHDLNWDGGSSTMYAGGASPWYGPAVFRSDDLGQTWTHSSEGLAYSDGGPPIKTVWNVTPYPGGLLAGVEPAGLFRSADGGRTWSEVGGLRDHPTRPAWQPGAGGLCLHSIAAHPTDADRIWVGISAVGAFSTTDGGRTWTTRNHGVRADFLPDPYPEFGQCVHKLYRAAGEPERLFQQNHCGVYRSLDGGANWDDITRGLPSQFGFPMVGHPRAGSTAWVIPLNGDDAGRYMPAASAAVWRTSDAGDSWQRQSAGLPQSNAYLGVLREAMAIDRLDPAGVYFGTSTGQLYGSASEGEEWSLIADHLPPIWSVESVVVEA